MGRGVTGLNHITLAVADVERSLTFYRDVLGLTVCVVWPDGAYLKAGTLWLCLAHDEAVRSSQRSDYTHVSFSVAEEDFGEMSNRLVQHCSIWKANSSEGRSTYFLDPDGHKLEIHVGSLESRLAHYREHPEKGVRMIDDLP